VVGAARPRAGAADHVGRAEVEAQRLATAEAGDVPAEELQGLAARLLTAGGPAGRWAAQPSGPQPAGRTRARQADASILSEGTNGMPPSSAHPRHRKSRPVTGESRSPAATVTLQPPSTCWPPTLYESTFSRTVWRLYGGTNGLVEWYYRCSHRAPAGRRPLPLRPAAVHLGAPSAPQYARPRPSAPPTRDAPAVAADTLPCLDSPPDRGGDQLKLVRGCSQRGAGAAYTYVRVLPYYIYVYVIILIIAYNVEISYMYVCTSIHAHIAYIRSAPATRTTPCVCVRRTHTSNTRNKYRFSHFQTRKKKSM
jgi:hypothetical protein